MRFGLHRILTPIALAVAISTAPQLAHAQAVGSVCKDGTTSPAKGRGACGKHGGIDPAATKAARDAARAASRPAKSAPRTVTCADGTTGAAGRGACSRHGGVQAGAGAQPETRADANAPAATQNPARPRAAAGAPAAASPRASASAGGREDNDPANAIAQCKDGLYSHASSRRGACSRHGGVKQWLHS